MLVKPFAGLVMAWLFLFSAQTMAEQGWPRTYLNPDGSKVVIEKQPKRILSTSVSVSGTLLAMDAPLIASATNHKGQFFGQWASVALDRGVEALWPIAEVDLEAAYSVKPDLIVVAIGGRDSAMQHLAMLRKIAPTIMVDYASQNWQNLALKISEATGQEKHTQAKIQQFDDYITSVKKQLKLPAGKTNIISYNGAGLVNPVAIPTGSHGSLLTALGFDMEAPNLAWHGAMDSPDDFVKSEYERLTELKADTTFLLRVDDSAVPRFMNDKTLANMPSIQRKQVYGLGKDSFRIDYFSGKMIADDMLKRFGQ